MTIAFTTRVENIGDRLLARLPAQASAELSSRGQVAVEATLNQVRWINATKNSETRQRRVEVSISKLRAGKRRPCCFDLSACTDPEVSRSGKLLEA